jgi:hypothetical protein
MVTLGRPEEAWPVIVAAIEMTDDGCRSPLADEEA